MTNNDAAYEEAKQIVEGITYEQYMQLKELVRCAVKDAIHKHKRPSRMRTDAEIVAKYEARRLAHDEVTIAPVDGRKRKV